jgi:hypothetical protein
MIELTFTSGTTYARPVLDPAFTATFTGSVGAVLTRPGFWDGGRTYKIRFSPTKAGTWTCVTYSTDTSLDNKRDTIICIPYNGTQPIFKHGFVKVSESGRYLCHDDGTPFLWMSDEHSFMDSEKWNSCNKPGCTCGSQFKHLVNLRKSQNFTVYQSVIWTVNSWETPGARPSLAYYQGLDSMFSYLANQGFVCSIALGYHKDLGADIQDSEKVLATRLAARYVEARYGAFPMVYYTCGEFNQGDFNHETCVSPIRQNTSGTPSWHVHNRSWWGEVAQTIADNNSYHHPVSVNYWQPQGTWFAEKPYFDFWALQAYSLRDYQYYHYWWKYPVPKPMIDAWSGMDHNTQKSLCEQRKIAYCIMQSGGAGWGHLTEGVWNNCLTKNACKCCDSIWGGTAWYTASDWTGVKYMTNAYAFYTSLQWWKLTPRFGDSTWGVFADQLRSAVSTDENKVYVVFFYNTTTESGTIKNMEKTAPYQAAWYNPRTGGYTGIKQNILPGRGTWKIPPKPDAEDWVLLVKKTG